MIRRLALVVMAWTCCIGSSAAQQVLRVGAKDAIKSVSAAAAKAQDGDVIEIAAGDYLADVAVWTKDRITVRGVGGRVRLIASGASAEQKAIWVVRGGSMVVENIEFIGARVADGNGAGIRFEKGHLVIRNCVFSDNENGILTSSDKTAELEIQGSEFGNNGAGDGRSHNLYVGAIRKLTVMGSYSHHARVGHLLKSRAAENYIAYNRLTDEIGGTASYELEFPNGGLAYVIGNIIQQGPATENPHLISFGAEGYAWPRNEIYLVNNTLVDDRKPSGVFLRVNPGANRIVAYNNLLVGVGSLEVAGHGQYAGNNSVDRSALSTDFRLNNPIRVTEKLADPGEANGISLTQMREYVHPTQTRKVPDRLLLPGALQGLAR
jgi:hypothetical protein